MKRLDYIYNLGLKFYEISDFYCNRNAIKFESGEIVTFDILNRKSNEIANFLLFKDVRPKDVVCIFNQKSLLGYSTILACLKIGAIYVNLDFTSPVERLKKILNTCNPGIICNDNCPNINFDEFSEFQIINFDTETRNLINRCSSKNLEITQHILGTNPAYIMFTSGSTGFPKGATMTHANVLNFIEWGKELYEVTENDIFTNVNPIYFDNSVFDFYVSIFSGACLAPFSQETAKDQKKLVEQVGKSEATIWFSVPSLLIFLLTTKALNENTFKKIRVITFGGEGFPKSKLKILFDLYKHRTRFVNVYGPTECTCICSAYDISEKDFEDMTGIPTLGHLIKNFSYYIDYFDNTDIGEICLSGPQVGLGYYNDFERTQKSFVQNPENSSYKEIMYRTGDLVKVGDYGNLYFMGRKDNQIKHMGYRIELEEVEAAFNIFSFVNEVCVIYKKLSENLGQIIAYISVSEQITENEILNEIKKQLPPYMVPKSIKILDVLPKNKNGKIDRFALTNL